MTDEKKYPDWRGFEFNAAHPFNAVLLEWSDQTGKTSHARRLIARIAEVYRDVKVWVVGPEK